MLSTDLDLDGLNVGGGQGVPCDGKERQRKLS